MERVIFRIMILRLLIKDCPSTTEAAEALADKGWAEYGE